MTSNPRARGLDCRDDDRDLLVANFAAFAGVGIQAAHGHACAGQAEITASLRRQFNGEFDLLPRERGGHAFERNVNGRQRHAQPAVPVIVAQQHHGGAIRAASAESNSVWPTKSSRPSG